MDPGGAALPKLGLDILERQMYNDLFHWEGGENNRQDGTRVPEPPANRRLGRSRSSDCGDATAGREGTYPLTLVSPLTRKD